MEGGVPFSNPNYEEASKDDKKIEKEIKRLASDKNKLFQVITFIKDGMNNLSSSFENFSSMIKDFSNGISRAMKDLKVLFDEDYIRSLENTDGSDSLETRKVKTKAASTLAQLLLGKSNVSVSTTVARTPKTEAVPNPSNDVSPINTSPRSPINKLSSETVDGYDATPSSGPPKRKKKKKAGVSTPPIDVPETVPSGGPPARGPPRKAIAMNNTNDGPIIPSGGPPVHGPPKKASLPTVQNGNSSENPDSIPSSNPKGKSNADILRAEMTSALNDIKSMLRGNK